MRLRHRLRNQRGSILLFTTVLVVPLMIIIAGLAMDLSYYGTVDDELQRSMDASALAGAGKLGFDNSVFPDVRQAAQDYATSNPYRAENTAKQITTSTFTQNPGNADSGNVVLGIWNGTTRTFTPSLNGSFVNAVKCRYASSIPTSFLKLIGLTSLSTAAGAIAISNPPASIPPTACLFPIGVSQCAFQAGGNFGSQGCGQPVSTFTSATVNTAAWINVNGTGTINAGATRDAVTAAANGTSCTGSTQVAGDLVHAQNGEVQNVISGQGQYPGIAHCNPGSGRCDSGYFIDKFNGPDTYTVRDSENNIVYQGHGWEVIVPVINTSCPPGPINQDLQVLTFSRMVITQVIDHGWCSVANHYLGNLWDAHCPPPNGTGSRDSNLSAVFGYYECGMFDTPPTPIPAPRAALATKLKLVR